MLLLPDDKEALFSCNNTQHIYQHTSCTSNRYIMTMMMMMMMMMMVMTMTMVTMMMTMTTTTMMGH